MIRYLIALVTLFVAGPAAAQTITGCSSVAANRVAASTDQSALQADVDCFGRAATQATDAAKVRSDRIKAIAFADCAPEGGVCRGTGWAEIRYGVGERVKVLTRQGDVPCDNATFGDPAIGVVKRCARRPTVPPASAAPASPTPVAPTQPGEVTPIATSFDANALLIRGIGLPKSSAPDVVGAFRMICTAGQMNWDDPILYPGQRGGSPHLHQWFGNTAGRYDSTYASLRAAGDSTCSNSLNRSAYWVPALMTSTGKVIQPDYVSLYYKRRPDGDPLCLKQSTKGCVGIPTGLRVVSGYDMKRMGEAQPENRTWTFRCITGGKPSVHRGTITEAVADCGGEGQIDAAINFGECWNGQLDSADHRSHLTAGRYIGQSYPQCPASHPYILPQLTQGVVYTIAKSDGDVWFASDRMHGMTMPSGSTFHADYMEGWEPAVRATWERECIGKMLNCSDGVLGDGTMLRRPGLTYKAAVRLVDVPTRTTP